MPDARRTSAHVIRFGSFEVNLRSGELHRDATRVPLQDQPFRVLARLVQQPGDVVTRDELRRELWPDNTFLDFDHGLNAAIKRLRDALGDSAESPRFIDTLPRRGYRFIAPVEVAGAGVSPPPADTPASKVPSGRRKVAAAALALLAAVVAGGLWILWVSHRRPSAPTGGAPDTVEAIGGPAVAVSIFENRTADPRLDVLGAQIGGRLIRSVAQIRSLDVATTPVDTAADRATGGIDAALSRARDSGAVLLVAGDMFLEGDRLELQARILEVPGGRLLHALPPFDAPIACPETAIESLERHVAGAVAIHFDEFFGGLSFISDPPPIDAYREYRAGLEIFSGDYPRALAHLQRALDLAPRFSLTRVIRLFAYGNLGESEKARAELSMLQPERNRLTAAERLFVEFLGENITTRRSAEALRVLQDLERIVPHSLLVNYSIVLVLLMENRPREAIEAYDRLPSDVRTLRYSIGTWRLSLLTRALHVRGEHDRELAESHRGQQEAPGMLMFVESEVRALAALGRLDDLQAVVDRSMTIPATNGSPGDVLEEAALELRAHGHRDVSIALANRAVEWQRAQPEGTEDRSSRFFTARALYLAERWEEAARMFESLHADPDRTPNAWWERLPIILGWVGACAARRGDLAGARAISAELRGFSGPDSHGLHTYLRAQIAALLGERQSAVDLLRQALGEGDWFGLHYHQDPDFESLRNYPPFLELVRPNP